MKYKIRKANVKDMDQIAEVAKESRSHNLPYLPELHSLDEDKAFYKEVVYKESKVLIAVESELQSIVGFIAYNHEFINHMYLRPKYQGMKIGSALLDLAKNDCTSLKLWTFQKNKLAQSFYLKHGFTVEKETDGSDNEEKEPDLLMTWSSITTR